MNVRIADLMVRSVMTTTAGQTVGHVREMMKKHRVQSMPVVGPDGTPRGIVTASDLIAYGKDKANVGQVMTRQVYTVPEYDDPSIAARVMRNHHIHHVIVTNEQKIVGILSTYDLLRLVEDHRFTMKNAPTNNSKAKGSRKKEELPGKRQN